MNSHHYHSKLSIQETLSLVDVVPEMDAVPINLYTGRTSIIGRLPVYSLRQQKIKMLPHIT